AHIPSAGISNQWLGYQSLDQLPLDTWSTVEFELPEGIVEALSGAYPDAQFLVTANLASNLAPLLIDHIRFSGQQVVLPRCGDGHVVGDEECDDGNIEDGD